MIGETKTQSKRLLSNLERKNYDSNKLNQICYKLDLRNNVFHLQSHHKMTAAFAVNKFLLLFDLNIFKTYTLSQETFAHICLFYFKVKAILQNLQETTSSRALFLLKLHEKETLAQLSSCEFCKTFKNTFYRTPPGDCLYRSWREVVRDVLALLLMTDFKECETLKTFRNIEFTKRYRIRFFIYIYQHLHDSNEYKEKELKN